MTKSHQTDVERSQLEVPQQFVTELLDDILAENNLGHNHLSVDDLHAFAISEAGSETQGNGHLIIVGEAKQIRLVSTILQPTELSRVYEIMYFEMRNGLLYRYHPTPSWTCQDPKQTSRRALDIYIDEERERGADGTSPFKRFYDRFSLWYRSTTGNRPPDRTRVRSMLPLEMTREGGIGGTGETQIIWKETR